MQEIEAIQAEVTLMPAPQRVSAQLAANDDDIRAVNYTIAAWDGGSDAYQYCSLPQRAPIYEGACVEAVPYTLTSVNSAPYACGAFPTGATVAERGTTCQDQVGLQLDCNAVCECVAASPDDPGTIVQGCSSTRCADAWRCKATAPALHRARATCTPSVLRLLPRRAAPPTRLNSAAAATARATRAQA